MEALNVGKFQESTHMMSRNGFFFFECEIIQVQTTKDFPTNTIFDLRKDRTRSHTINGQYVIYWKT